MAMAAAAAAEEVEVSPGFEKYVERVDVDDSQDLVYDDAEHEPELHFRTWIALASMFLYNYVIIITLLSPAAVVSQTGCSQRHLGVKLISPCSSLTSEPVSAQQMFKHGC